MAIGDSGYGQFTSRHSFLSGLILIAIGVAGVYGSISGQLAAMLAALFDPTDLYTIQNATANAPAVPGLEPSGGGGSGGGSPTPTSPGLPGPPALPGPTPPALPGLPELPVIAL